MKGEGREVVHGRAGGDVGVDHLVAEVGKGHLRGLVKASHERRKLHTVLLLLLLLLLGEEKHDGRVHGVCAAAQPAQHLAGVVLGRGLLQDLVLQHLPHAADDDDERMTVIHRA